MLKMFLISILPLVMASLPADFVETQITGNGLSNLTAIAVHPDGRVFVCQQTGELRVIRNGVVLPTPFLTLGVNSSGERGLLGVTFDPNYATNRFVYVYYTATTPTIHNRVSRFTANAANEDVAVAGSEVVLLDLETLGETNHNGGAIHFGPDGKLYIAVGENAFPPNSQSLANRLGKILRINSDGTIPPDNPTSFPNIAGSPAGVNRAIWAIGLRNPFTFSFQPGTGRMHINDVGQGTWEEVNVGTAGANFGWSVCEGACGTAGMTNPLYQYSSAPASPCAITGGAFYNPTTPTFPAQFIGKYFFADYCAGWIKVLDPLSPPATGAAVDFATGISFPVDIQVANDGSLYYLARGSNSVFRVQYAGTPVVDKDAPVIATEANSQRAIALDTAISVRDPFMITNDQYFGADKRTRVSLFATNLELKAGLVITAQAVDSQQVTHQLPVEFVGGLPTLTGFTQIVVKVPDGIATAGDLHVTITAGGKTSNVALIGVRP